MAKGIDEAVRSVVKGKERDPRAPARLGVERMAQTPRVAPDLSDALGSCPYSEETVTGCRFYLPVSQHGGFPGAARCQLAVKLPTPNYIHQSVCRRRIVGAAHPHLDVRPRPL